MPTAWREQVAHNPVPYERVGNTHKSVWLRRRPAAGQDASAVHPQSARACDAHAGADSWQPLVAVAPGHVPSGVPWNAYVFVLQLIPKIHCFKQRTGVYVMLT